MIPWLVGCTALAPPAPAPPPVVVVELAWPGADATEVDGELATRVDAVLAPLASLRRCESLDGFVRCLVEGAEAPPVQAALADERWPDAVEPPVVRPLPPPQPGVVVVLDPGPAAWAWEPQVWVHRRWPVARVEAPTPLPLGTTADQLAAHGARIAPLGEARCDGQPAAALWVAAAPQVPPPPGASVRTWQPTHATFVEGAGPAARFPAPPPDTRWCALVHDQRVEGLVDLPPEEAAAALPGLDIVPAVAHSRRYLAPPQGLGARADTLRQRPDVWAVRQVHDRHAPRAELVVDADRLAAHGLTARDLRSAFGAPSVAVGDLRLAVHYGDDGPDLQLPVPTPGGATVPLGQLARLEQAQAPQVRVRVNGRRGAVVEVLVDDPAHAEAVDAAVGLEPLEDWARRTHRP